MQATGQRTAPHRLPPAALHYAAIANAASKYLAAMPEDATAVLGVPVAAIWHGKRATRNRGLELVVRADAWGSGATSFLLLFREHGDWKIAGDARADAESRQRDSRFTSRDTESEVLAVLEEYYRAVTHSDGAAIRRIFAPCWYMKSHEGDLLVSEETDACVKRLEESFPTYWDDRQVADVQISANRTDRPHARRPAVNAVENRIPAGTKLRRWKMIDKAFTDGKEEMSQAR